MSRNRRTTDDIFPPKKRPCTSLSVKRATSLVSLPSNTGGSEMMPQLEAASALVSLNGASFPAQEGQNVVLSSEEYDQALKERGLALNELDNLRAELKKVQDNRSKDLAEFELGKKVLEAEKKGINERADKDFINFASELKYIVKQLCQREADLEKTSQERDSYRSSLELGKKEWEDEKKALDEKLDKEINKFASEVKDVLKNLCKSEAELEKTSQERDSYRNNLESGKKEWEDEKKALTERFNEEINNFGVELKEAQGSLFKCEVELEKTSQERDSYRNNLELGNKEWEDEKKVLIQSHNDDRNMYESKNKYLTVSLDYLVIKLAKEKGAMKEEEGVDYLEAFLGDTKEFDEVMCAYNVMKEMEEKMAKRAQES
ncbi:uncharacterized protein LOC126788296 [Argentina anserina]|uniref:uncharacterized protein LOC126788296 n=1 Tax=Argentina anserina TaxID=57926 RepID=UPI0021769233|nr:uncharacterized protein LOC126788296 [Potentilla anserina]